MEVLYSIMLMSCLGDKDNSFIAASQLFGIKISAGSIVLPQLPKIYGLLFLKQFT